jgi:hypothetical protein
MRQSAAVVHALQATRWSTLNSAFAVGGSLAPDGKSLRDQVVKILTEDELTSPLVVRLQAIQAAAEDLIQKALKLAPTPVAPSTPPSLPPAPTATPAGKELAVLELKGTRNRLDAQGVAQLALELQQKLARDGGRVSLTWSIEK